MSIEPSGRIVIEVEQNLKRELHSALLRDGITLKEWFVAQVTHFLADHQQLHLTLDDVPQPLSRPKQS